MKTQAASIVERLSPRDGAILFDLARVRVLTGGQLTRLHFHDLAPDSRERTRRRVLARLIDLQLVTTLDRTIGGARADGRTGGSAAHIYALGIAGQYTLPLLACTGGVGDEMGMSATLASRPRSPTTPGRLFLAHTLGVSELYVELRERERERDCALSAFDAEAAAWHPDGRGGVIKPDVYTRLRHGEIEDCWWCEVDKATESIPTLKRKLVAYAEFARTGQLGPDGVMPRVLLTVPHDRRLVAVRDLVEALPPPGPELILPVLHGRAVAAMIAILRG